MEEDKKITTKTGYEAMIKTLDNFWNLTEDREGLLTILSGGTYLSDGTPADSAFWDYWLDAIKQVEEDGPVYMELHDKRID